MMNTSPSQDGRIPPLRFSLRLVWVVFQLLLVYWLGESGTLFFYQGF